LFGSLASGFLFLFKLRSLEFNLPKILYVDSQKFYPKLMKPDDYFKETTTKSENNMAQINSPRNQIVTELGDINNENTLLQLAENQNIGLENKEAIYNNFAHRTTVVEKSIETVAKIEEGSSDDVQNIYSLLDYSNLNPKDSLKYDNRNTIKFIKDRFIADHTIINLIFNYSLREPRFIRVINLVFSLSMQLAINSMLYTDSYIEDLLAQANQVNVFLT
jgi:hypothetical protein